MPSSMPTTFARRNGQRLPFATSRHAWRTYATEPTPRPPLSQGGSNRPVIVGLAVVVPLLAYWAMSPGRKTDQPSEVAIPPKTDPVERHRANKAELEANGPKYKHPEHENPEDFKPAFGQLHKQKRVDGAPDDRNHQSMQDRQRQR